MFISFVIFSQVIDDFTVFNTFASSYRAKMNRNLIVLIGVTLVAITSLSCSHGNSKNDIPASVVDNPNSASGSSSRDQLPVITFEKDFHDFGTLHSGEKVTYSFKFRNTGKSLLVISTVSTSCGCTISDYPHQPIKVGDGATIDVSFDSEGKHGIQNKTVTVFSNTQPPTNILRIKASIVEPDENE